MTSRSKSDPQFIVLRYWYQFLRLEQRDMIKARLNRSQHVNIIHKSISKQLAILNNITINDNYFGRILS